MIALRVLGVIVGPEAELWPFMSARKAAVPGDAGNDTGPPTSGVRPVPAGVKPVLGVNPVLGVRPVRKEFGSK